MTTICYKDGILVGDSLVTRMTDNFCYRDSTVRKVKTVTVNVPGVTAKAYFAEAGDSQAEGTFEGPIVRYIKTNKYEDPVPEDETYGMFVVNNYFCLKVYEFYDSVEPILSPHFALGTGRLFALGAMQAGATALEALYASIKLDVYSGFPIFGYNCKTGEEIEFESEEAYLRAVSKSQLSEGSIPIEELERAVYRSPWETEERLPVRPYIPPAE